MKNTAFLWWKYQGVRQVSDNGGLSNIGRFSYIGGDIKDIRIGINAVVSYTGGSRRLGSQGRAYISAVGIDSNAIGGGGTTSIGDIG